MALRTLTIQPFVDPSNGSVSPVTVSIVLVNRKNDKVLGVLAGTEGSVFGGITATVNTVNVTTGIWPQTDIEGMIEYGSETESETYYLTTVTNVANSLSFVFRTQVADGGALSWNEFRSGSTDPVTPAELAIWQTHPSDTSNPHSVTAAQVGADPAGILSFSAAPSGFTDTGTQGQIAWDGVYLWICVASPNTWVKLVPQRA